MNSPSASKLITTVEKASERIASAGIIAVVIPSLPSIEIIGSAAALIAGLRRLKKVVSVFGPTLTAATALAPWQNFGEDREPLREFIISFDLARSPIKELKYERDENRLSIILSPKGPHIRREDIEFRYGALHYDLVITLGVPRLEDAAESIRQLPELLYEKPVLNIDVSPENSGYGELNLLPSTENPRSILPEVIYNLLKVLDARPSDSPASSALLAALYAATQGFSAPNITAVSFNLAGELLKLGAVIPGAGLYLPPPRCLEERQLEARALVRTRLDKKTKVCWSLLTQEDFAKTQAAPANISEIFAEVIRSLPPARHYVLLWQSPDDGKVRTLIHHAEAVNDQEAATPNAAANIIAPAEEHPSFAAAEEHIAQLLPSNNALQ